MEIKDSVGNILNDGDTIVLTKTFFVIRSIFSIKNFNNKYYYKL